MAILRKNQVLLTAARKLRAATIVPIVSIIICFWSHAILINGVQELYKMRVVIYVMRIKHSPQKLR